MLLRCIWSPRALSVIAVAALFTASLGESAQAQSRRCTKGGLRACTSSRLVQSGVATATAIGGGMVLYAKSGKAKGVAKGKSKNGWGPAAPTPTSGAAPPTASGSNDQTPTTATPEPATMALLGTGIAALGGWRKRRRNKAA